MLNHNNITLGDYLLAHSSSLKTKFCTYFFNFRSIFDGRKSLISKRIKLNELLYEIETIKYYQRLHSGNNNYKNLSIDVDSIEFCYNNERLKFFYDCKRQLNNTLSMTGENFLDEQFKNFHVRGKNVIDIGANIGDTAIYFALNGAKRVFAYEPYPYSYLIAKKNIEKNKLMEKITLRNIGCGKSGHVNIDEGFKNVAGCNIKKFNAGKKIPIHNLSEIIKECHLNNCVMKIDCEGHEYDLIINSDSKDLRLFSNIAMEYHYGYIDLENKLKSAGFNVKKTAPRYFLNNEVANKKMYVGMLYATRLNVL